VHFSSKALILRALCARKMSALAQMECSPANQQPRNFISLHLPDDFDVQAEQIKTLAHQISCSIFSSDACRSGDATPSLASIALVI
jgi:hypothetical protein